MLRHTLIAACALVLAGAGTTAAQERAPVVEGDRVRISVPVFVNGYELTGGRSAPRVGTLTALDSSNLTLRLDRDGSEFTAPLSGVRVLEVSRGAVSSREGRSRGLRRGTLMGAGVGLAGVALFTMIEASQDSFNEQSCGAEFVECTEHDSAVRPVSFAIGTGVGAAAGAVIGLALGSRARDRWEQVDVRSLRVAPGAAGTRVGVSLRL